MYSLKYKVTTSTCDSEGRMKLYSALQMMQDCSEMWIDSEPGVKQYFAEQKGGAARLPSVSWRAHGSAVGIASGGDHPSASYEEVSPD